MSIISRHNLRYSQYVPPGKAYHFKAGTFLGQPIDLVIHSMNVVPEGTFVLMATRRDNETVEDWAKRCVVFEGVQP